MNIHDFHWSDMITKVVAAIVILIVTALVASLIKKVLTTQLGKVRVLNRHQGSGATLAESLGTVVSLVVWLFGLMAVLNLFALTQVLSPLQVMLARLLSSLPNVLGAALVMFIGVVLAKIVRELLVTALQATNIDRFAQRAGIGAKNASSQVYDQNAAADQAYPNPDLHGGPANGGYNDPTQAYTAPMPNGASQSGARRDASNRSATPISNMLGQLVFAVIVMVVAIAALQLLNIHSISDPATHMLHLVLDAIPVVIGAGILLAIGVMIARFVGDLAESLLRGMDTDSALAKLGADTSRTDVPKLVARIVQVAIVMFFAVAATNLLHFPQISAMLNTVLGIGGRVIFGAVIILAGVFLAHLLASFVSGRTGEIIKVAAIVLFAAIGLRQMGLANSIINLAFGAVVIGGAVAAALAFGLGGRNAAARQLDKMQAEAEVKHDNTL